LNLFLHEVELNFEVFSKFSRVKFTIQFRTFNGIFVFYLGNPVLQTTTNTSLQSMSKQVQTSKTSRVHQNPSYQKVAKESATCELLRKYRYYACGCGFFCIFCALRDKDFLVGLQNPTFSAGYNINGSL
jgi:hypothetical protein